MIYSIVMDLCYLPFLMLYCTPHFVVTYTVDSLLDTTTLYKAY